MQNINYALLAKVEKSLNVKMLYDEGIFTKKEWIKLKFKQGAIVETANKNRIDFNRIKFNRMNYKEQEIYEKKCNEKITCYKLKEKNDNCYFEITKTEYDYFNSLNN
jgi:hypothetical protein